MTRVTAWARRTGTVRITAIPAALGCAVAALALLAASDAPVQPPTAPSTVASGEEARDALARAQAQGAAARVRAEKLEAAARQAKASVERNAAEAAAVAARVQQAEATIAANTARISMIDRERALLRAELGRRQKPLVELTAALQRIALRPPVLSLLRPGSLADAVYLRATLEAMVPQVERQTAWVRGELARGKVLQQQARVASAALRAEQAELARRRQKLVALESSLRLEAAQVSGVADREAERALALGEQARDLGALAQALDAAGALRAELAALPGPVARPARIDPAAVPTVVAAPSAPAPSAAASLGRYLMPVQGRLVAGFGAPTPPGAPRSRGLTLAAPGGAQAVAPAPGRIAFAGPYSGYGRIVIVEHPGGWTTLVTGLADVAVTVGQTVIAGSPLGIAPPLGGLITLELRRQGQPLNPLDAISG